MRLIRTVGEELEFERTHVAAQEATYLASNPLLKATKDLGYRAKVERVRESLVDIGGPILDIGSNTCGEAEYLSHLGYRVVATDINYLALDISRRRCASQGRPAPEYVCCSGQLLPFQPAGFEAVTFIESLHHMPVPELALAEAFRVLAPGGVVIGFEPCSRDPWRRVSEVRDYVRGSIETSFSVAELARYCTELGFAEFATVRFVDPPSQVKLAELGPTHRMLRRAYFRARMASVGAFGMIQFSARKPGRRGDIDDVVPLQSLLRCVITGEPLRRVESMLVSETSAIQYPETDGIPRLTLQDARLPD